MPCGKPNSVNQRTVQTVSETQSSYSAIAKPYAAALFDLAKETKSLPAVEKSLDGLAATIASSADLQRFLKSPVFTKDQQENVIAAMISKSKEKGIVANFLGVIAGNRRLFALSDIITAFKAMAAQERGEVKAEVTSAQALTKKHLDALAKTLKSKLGKTVTLDAKVDPSLIGGLIVKVGSQMIDSSLKTKLTAMKIAMKEVG